MDAAEYKHVVLGLIFLKYISDAFEEKYAELKSDPMSDPEDRDYYLAENIFWVVKEASKFASAEGKNGGEFYTPRSIVRLLVEMIEPKICLC